MSDAPYTYALYRELFARDMTDAYADRTMTMEVGRAMGKKLQKKRRDGRGGWWDPKQCTVESLRVQMVEHIEKGDMIDVINFAGMIHMRQILEET